MNPIFDELLATFKYEEDAKEWVKDRISVFHRYYIIKTDNGYAVYDHFVSTGW